MPIFRKIFRLKSLLNQQQIELTIKRLAHQILENTVHFDQTVLIGLQPRGIFLSNRIVQELTPHIQSQKPEYGKLDITFYRDDVRKELRDRYNARTVWIHCALDILVERDTKGLYRKALLPSDHPDKITNLTGVNDVYEIPIGADLVIYTHTEDLETSAVRLFAFILDNILETGS